MLLSIEHIEEILRSTFCQQVTNPGIKEPIKFLQQWSYLSSQVPRLHGAALARVQIPDIQCLLSEIAYGECGFGNRNKIHCKLLLNLIEQAPCADLITRKVDNKLTRYFESNITQLCQMNQDEAIGFIVGLEAPAYDILKLLKQSFATIGIPEEIVSQSEYMVIHDAVEKEHQESGHEAMKIILDYGCNLSQLQRGGEHAVRFLVNMVGDGYLKCCKDHELLTTAQVACLV